MTASLIVRKIVKLVPKKLWHLIDPTSYRIKDFISKMGDELPGGSYVLDAGAGETPYKKFFEGHHYFAVDTQWGDPGWDYSKLDSVGDLTALPFNQNSFDRIICTQVLEHVNEPEKVIREFSRTMKKGGCLYLSAPQGWCVHQAPYDYFRYTQYGLEHLLNKTGFKMISATPTCGYYGYLANRLTVFPKTMFWQIENRILRIALFPLELLSYVLFVLVLPVLLNLMDGMDKKQDYTLNYMVKAVKDGK